MAQIDPYLEFMIESGASDFHFCSGVPPTFRLDGDMVTVDDAEPMKPEEIETIVDEIMDERNKKEFAETNDTDLAYEIEGLARFRVNVFRDKNGVGTVIRQIPAKILSADDLDLPKAVRDFCKLNKGLVVVTGPTGSGKTTTLAAMIDLINETRTDHIITIEDPIEFVHPNKKCLINHRELNRHTTSFKRGLRAALREDPDILLIGEMRDLDTIEIAIEMAETGHLVFGTLHTTTAPSTVDRIIDQFPADRQNQIRSMLSESLKGVVSQALLKKIGGGRVAALEILVCVPAVANLIRERKVFQIPSIMQTGQKFGMRMLNDSLMKLVKDGVVTATEALSKSVSKAELQQTLEREGFEIED